MLVRRSLCAILLTAMPATSALASPLDFFTDLLVFGDSLSDPGNAFVASGGTIPDPFFYPDGQFTNGDVWATQLGADLASGTNFAFGGARAADDGDIIPDFLDQVALYDSSGLVLGDHPLVAVFVGGNDLRAADTPAEAAETIAAATSAIAEGIGALIETGLSDFVVLGLPDAGRLPEVAGTPGSSFFTQATLAFNAALQAAIAPLGAQAEVTYFDTFAFFQRLFETPAAFGFENTTESCLENFPLCTPGSADTYVFYDDLHPTEAVHSLLADAVAAEIAPIPLPASLPFALTGFALVLGASARSRKPRASLNRSRASQTAWTAG